MSTSQVPIYSVIPPYMGSSILSYYNSQQTAFHSPENDNKIKLQEISNKITTELRGLRSQVQNLSNSSAGLKASATTLTSPAPREVWDALSDSSKPPKLVSSTKTNTSTTENDALHCFQNMQKVDTFCREVLRIYPVDTPTHLMTAYVHDPKEYNNACWNPNSQDVHFGDVDPNIMKPIANDFGLTMHEFGHAITHYSSKLIYENQSGALNESMSDVFAIMAEHYIEKKPANDPNTSWLIGKNILINSQGTGTAIRSMNNPGSAYKNHMIMGDDPQPDHMRNYKNCSLKDDHGGVHHNCSIPNKAFYLAASAVGGSSWEKTGQVWFKTLLNAQSNYNFVDFANLTVKIAQQDYGNGVSNLIGKAWFDVGVQAAYATNDNQIRTNNSTTIFNTRNCAILAGCGIAIIGTIWYKFPVSENINYNQ